jgi:SAM-dependent methyltransferase
VAADYGRHVLSVREHDRSGLVLARIDAHADPGATAADIGCGVGEFTVHLARRFRRVEACDHSKEALARTRDACRGTTEARVRLHHVDIVSAPAPFEPVDFVLCVNVLLMPALDERMRAWRFATNQTRSGGKLLLVVPSHESILFQVHLSVAADLADGRDGATAEREAARSVSATAPMHLGVHMLSGVPTKHYLADELRALFDEHHLELEELTRLEYPPGGPHVLGDGVWDWLAVGRRR